MLELFRKNLFVYNFFLLVYCLILRMSWFVYDLPVTEVENALLSNFVYRGLGIQSIWIKVLSIVLLIYHAIQINRLVSLNRLTAENTLFSGLFYLLLLSLTADFIPLHPAILANTFLIIMLVDIFKQTRNVDLHLNIFNVGLWVGMASLFYFPYILFFPVGIIGVIYLRTFKTIDLLRAIMGLVVPYFLMATILYLTDSLGDLWYRHISGAFQLLDINFPFGWQQYTVIGLFVLISLFSMVSMGSFSTGSNIHVRRKISVLFITLVGAVLLTMLVNNTGVQSLLFATVPLSIFLAMLFLKLEKQVAEILHFLLLSMAIAFQYLV